jgi:hypothetical protein
MIEREKRLATNQILKNEIKMFDSQGSPSNSKESVGVPKLIQS